MKISGFRIVDVFTHRPFKGNPVAVVLDASKLSDVEMQQIARWTNLSETTFVFPPQHERAHYRVRIFTPGSELPFAGHPTIGTAHALLEAGLIKTGPDNLLIQECAAGLITLTVSPMLNGGQSIAFELPEPAIHPLSTEQALRLSEILGCELDLTLTPALVDVGARWIVARIADTKGLLGCQPDHSRLAIHDTEMQVTGICLFSEYTVDNDETMKIEVRSFAPSCGVNEDPVCGSGNGSVAAFLRHHNIACSPVDRLQSRQGRVIGRDGEINLIIEDKRIFVGGQSVTCVSGTVTL